MSYPKIAVNVLPPAKAEERKALILDILSRKRAVKFTNTLTGVKKYVVEWNPDIDGDLTAIHSTGVTLFVCWGQPNYEVSEVSKEEVPK